MMLKLGCATIAGLLSVSTNVRAANNEILYWSFTGQSDGTQPRGDLVVGLDNRLYGTASSGGVNQSGTVFSIAPDATGTKESTIYSFSGGSDGSLPSSILLQDSSGALYGTAARNGALNAGTVFRLTPPAAGQSNWNETTLWSFTGGADGAQPIAGLIADLSGSGVLYGTTNYGGANGLGAVFSLTPPTGGQGAWTEQTLWSFTGAMDGAKPASALVQAPNGKLYGTASSGGGSGAGTVFELTPTGGSAPAWNLKTVWTFSGGADGAAPMAALIVDSAGSLYGTTEFGGGGDCSQARYPYYSWPESESAPAFAAAYVPVGGNNCGVAFKLVSPATPNGAWTQSILWSFQAGFDGGNPVAALLLDSSGALHGVTPQYGDAGPNGLNQYADKGNVFVLTPTGQAGGTYTETTTLSFGADNKGIYPRAGLVAGPRGLYYTTQTFGGDTWVHVKVYGYGSVVSTE
jgi:uncharacterized repeat protein (TIGR03803 family)